MSRSKKRPQVKYGPLDHPFFPPTYPQWLASRYACRARTVTYHVEYVPIPMAEEEVASRLITSHDPPFFHIPFRVDLLDDKKFIPNKEMVETAIALKLSSEADSVLFWARRREETQQGDLEDDKDRDAGAEELASDEGILDE
jgi:hypothetical protein